MSEEKYDSSIDVHQSGVRFVSTESGDAATDFNCERLCYAIESLCHGRKIVQDLPPSPEEDDEEEEEGDRLDPLFDSDDFPQPFVELIYSNIDDIFIKDNNIVIIEFIFNCAYSLLFENIETLNTNIDKLSIILSTQSDDFNKLNIKLLCLLFNLIPKDNKYRFIVMQRLLDLGKNIKTILAQELFRGQLNLLSDWIENDWNKYLTLKEKKCLYQSASFVAKKAAEKEIYLKYLICYLKLFDYNDINDDENKENNYSSVVDEAAQAIIAAISCDDFNTKNVMELIHSNIICNVMSKTPKYKELYSLLVIIYEGNVNDFEIFYKENKEKMISLGLIYEHLQKKIRLLTLCTLGSNYLKPLYSFDELMKCLQLNTQNELEELIIDAITKKLLDAKIDYSTNQINITKAKQRTFNKNSWIELSKKLSIWRQNTNTVLQIIHNVGINRLRQQYMQEMAKQAKNQ